MSSGQLLTLNKSHQIHTGPWSINLATNYAKIPVLTIQFASSKQPGNLLFYRFQATDTITTDKKPNN